MYKLNEEIFDFILDAGSLIILIALALSMFFWL